jgi:serine/threonine protein kinase
MSRVDEPLSSSDWETLLKDVLHERPPFDDSDLPAQIGRYRVGAILGRGGYGVVYLAYDERLQRPVAVKVPYQERLAQPEDVELFLAEANWNIPTLSPYMTLDPRRMVAVFSSHGLSTAAVYPKGSSAHDRLHIKRLS